MTPWTAARQAPCPWDSPGKNTGVDCHFLLQCTKVKSEREVAQSYLILKQPRGPGSSVRGIFQARVLEWHAIAFSDLVTRCTHIKTSHCHPSVRNYFISVTVGWLKSTVGSDGMLKNKLWMVVDLWKLKHY